MNKTLNAAPGKARRAQSTPPHHGSNPCKHFVPMAANGLEIAARALSTTSDASTSLSRFMEADSGGCYTGFFTKAAQILSSAEPSLKMDCALISRKLSVALSSLHAGFLLFELSSSERHVQHYPVQISNA